MTNVSVVTLQINIINNKKLKKNKTIRYKNEIKLKWHQN